MKHDNITLGAAIIALCLGVGVGRANQETAKAESVTYAYVVQVDDHLEAVDWRMTAEDCAKQLAADSNVVQGRVPTPSGVCVASSDSSMTFTP